MSEYDGGRGPDWGIAKILRGFAGFEDYYQGMSAKLPVALSLNGDTLLGRDAQAKRNYDILSPQLQKQPATGAAAVDSPGVDGETSPNLLEGLSCSLGTSMTFVLPRPLERAVAEGYVYKIVWRYRTAESFAATGVPFHSNVQNFRYQDENISSTGGWDTIDGEGVFKGKAAQRGVIPTFSETIRFTQTPGEDFPSDLAGLQIARDTAFQPAATYGSQVVLDPLNATAFGGPLLPFAGARGTLNPVTGRRVVIGEFGQTPPAGAPTVPTNYASFFRNNVSHVTYTTVAKGDEAILLVYPRPIPPDDENPVYNFDTTDFLFSVLFGRGGYQTPNASPRVLFPNGTTQGAYVINGY